MNLVYQKMQFTNVQEASKEEKSLGVDKTHFSGEFPTVFFKEVNKFDSETLKEIAKIHHNLWNYKKVLFLYVTSKTEIKIYNCSAKPFDYKIKDTDLKKELKQIELASSDTDKLDELFEIFSASAIDSGSIWTRDNNYLKQLKLNKRVDSFLVESLVATAKELKKQGLDLEVVHSLIMRSLFIIYLEDKGATPEDFYKKEKQNAHSYFDLLEDKDATYNFFEKIKENFNGNVFPVSSKEKNVELHHLELIKKCFINGDIKGETLFSDWRIFKFDIIEIELLSEIYEQFLGKLQKETGSYYTSPALVELMLNEVLPVKNNEKEYNLKILDPTCGSGIFLVEAYKRIVKRWQNAHPNKVLDFRTLKELMLNSIYGIELNPKSIKVASFSLYLSLLEFLNPKNLWYLDGEKFPYLINDEEDESIDKQGYNLFRADTIEENKKFEKEYDLIIGNPPYGTKGLSENIKEYCNQYNFQKEFVIPFVHKSSFLALKGKIALLVPTKLLTNTSGTSQNFRQWLFNDNYVEKIYNLSILRQASEAFGGSLFSSAVAPASILFFQKEAPLKKSKTIEYWAPKTYIKNHIAEGVLIDSSDIKFLPREECEKPNTKIWKIAQWGTLNDFTLLNNLKNSGISFRRYIENNKIKHGVGFRLLSSLKTKIKQDDSLNKLPYLKASSIKRFYTPNYNNYINDSIKESRKKTQNIYLKLYKCNNIEDIPPINKFKTTAKYLETFKAPHFVLKKGFIDTDKICTTYLDYDCSFRDGVYGFYSETKDITILKYLTILFSSNYAHYFLLMTASSYMVEREQIMLNEYLELTLPNITVEVKEKLSNIINNKIENSKHILEDVYIDENYINTQIYGALNISKNEQIFIDDAIKYTIDLFHKGHKSIAVQPLDIKESKLYAIKLSEEINEVLEDSDMKLIAKVYSPSYYNPLSLIKFQFVEKSSNKKLKVVSTNSEFDNSLSKLNKYTLDEYTKSIYMQKNITYYDDDLIYIIKPNQKRFWTQSQAIEDAQNITLEIMSMNNG